ncbi:hypothetical protein D5086_015124 [Populus alba]|uniref:Uncharacterized protein n=1 Tax=Populus alba TaxID=43335 RepID=A0ACC4BZF8_POPAL
MDLQSCNGAGLYSLGTEVTAKSYGQNTRFLGYQESLMVGDFNMNKIRDHGDRNGNIAMAGVQQSISKLKLSRKLETGRRDCEIRPTFVSIACEIKTAVVYPLSTPNMKHQPMSEAEDQDIMILQSQVNHSKW